MNTESSKDAYLSLLELAANNDVECFKKCVDREPSSVDEAELWYGRQKGSNQMVLQQMTPLMVAATYGSIDVVKFLLSFPDVDVNQSCGVDQSTALHYAASSGTANAVEIVKLLIEAGADPSLSDSNGCCPYDVIVVSPKSPSLKSSLQMLLVRDGSFEDTDLTVLIDTSKSNSDSPPPSPCQRIESPDSTTFSKGMKLDDVSVPLIREKKEYPIDPFMPDIKNSIYSSDEFRMFSFKVRPCSRAYSHDWTECPFVHPGENARRRDPRKFHYSCVPCSDFRKGACRRGDMCEYAHGVFECWLHPAQYRTRICKDGTACSRRVCFFAHTQEELRPLYMSSGSGVHSPRSSSSAVNGMDFAAAMVLPGSPSSVTMMSPSPFTPPISPSSKGMLNSSWPSQQQNVPTISLSGGNFQMSRLHSSLNARDIDVQQQHLMNEMAFSMHSKMLSSSNLDDVFSESPCPRYPDQALSSSVMSPTHKSAVLNQFQQHQQGMLSPIKTAFSPRNMDHSQLQTPFGVASSSRNSLVSGDPISPMSARLSLLAHQDKKHQQFRSLSSRDLLSQASSAASPLEDPNWSKWGQPLWTSTMADDSAGLRRSSSFELVNNGDEPDLSWVHSLVKESSQERSAGVDHETADSMEQVDQSVLDAWLEQMRLDQLMAQ